MRKTDTAFVFALSSDPVRRLAVSDAKALPALGDRVAWRKDILRVGSWHNDAWAEPWTVTPKILQSLAEGFRLAQAAGDPVPVVMVPPDADDQHAEAASTKIGEVSNLTVEGDTLYATLWTADKADPKVYQLDTHAQQVSVDVRQDWTLGTGARVPWFLKHVAVVTHAVMTGQGPFVRQLSQVPFKGSKKMAKAKDDKQMAEGDDGFSLDEVKQMLSQLNVNIPDVATTKEAIMAVVAAFAGPEKSAGDAATETAEAMMPADMAQQVASNPSGYTPAQVSLACRVLGKAFKLASTQAAESAKIQLAAAKSNFETMLGRHVTRGAISEADKASWLELGERVGFQMASVKALDSIPDNTAFPAGKSKARQFASTNHTGEQDADAEIQARADGAKNRLLAGMGIPAKAPAKT